MAMDVLDLQKKGPSLWYLRSLSMSTLPHTLSPHSLSTYVHTTSYLSSCPSFSNTTSLSSKYSRQPGQPCISLCPHSHLAISTITSSPATRRSLNGCLTIDRRRAKKEGWTREHHRKVRDSFQLARSSSLQEIIILRALNTRHRRSLGDDTSTSLRLASTLNVACSIESRTFLPARYEANNPNVSTASPQSARLSGTSATSRVSLRKTGNLLESSAASQPTLRHRIPKNLRMRLVEFCTNE